MIKTITGILVAVILLNFNLISFASDINKSNSYDVYSLDTNYKSNFISQIDPNSNLILKEISVQEQKDISSNIWLWSVLFPGLGQLFMGEYGWGSFFSLLALSLIAFSGVLIMSSSGMGSVGAGIAIIGLGVIDLIAYITLYISSLLNAQSLNTNLTNKNQIEIPKEQTISDKNIDTQNLLWTSSIIVPGMGQALSGEVFRGISFFTLEALLISSGVFAMTSVLSQNFTGYLVVISILSVFHIWNIIDAYQVNQSKNTNIQKVSKNDNNSGLEKALKNINITSNSMVYKIEF